MKEHYTDQLPLQQWNNIPPPDKLKIQTPSQTRFCLDQRALPMNQSYYSVNQALASNPYHLNTPPPAGNPKTRITPLIIPAILDPTYWSEDFVVPQGINDNTNDELYLSGQIDLSNQCGQTSHLKTTFNPTTYTSQPYPQQQQQINPIIEPFHLTPSEKSNNSLGDVYGCGYNPNNLNHNLPTNITTGQCSTNDAFNTYNKNLYTQSIDPNIFARNQTVEPLNSNIGIDWTQQFEPVKCERDEYGNKIFISEDPRLSTPVYPNQNPPSAEPHNVYDPRFVGYGTSYRQYIDPMSGQPRFYYDDVDAIRRPNFIIRSNIDDAPWAPSYGPLSSDSNASNTLNHALANKKFVDGSLELRTHLQERYMRKYNSEIGWQRRLSPLNTQGSLKTI